VISILDYQGPLDGTFQKLNLTHNVFYAKKIYFDFFFPFIIFYFFIIFSNMVEHGMNIRFNLMFYV